MHGLLNKHSNCCNLVQHTYSHTDNALLIKVIEIITFASKRMIRLLFRLLQLHRHDGWSGAVMTNARTFRSGRRHDLGRFAFDSWRSSGRSHDANVCGFVDRLALQIQLHLSTKTNKSLGSGLCKNYGERNGKKEVMSLDTQVNG